MVDHASSVTWCSTWRACYGWKAPRIDTKQKEVSLVLLGVALAFYILRFSWPFQFAKFWIRHWRQDNHVPPIYAELYLFGTIVAAPLLMLLVEKVPLAAIAIDIIGGGGFLVACESVTANLYYLVLRPVLEDNPPHQVYRSFVMSLLGLLQYWLSISLAIFASGHTIPPAFLFDRAEIPNITTALYFVATTMFTVGYGDITPDKGCWYAMWAAILIMSGGFVLITISIARAVSAVGPKPPQ